MSLFEQLKAIFGEEIAKTIVEGLKGKEDVELIVDSKKEPKYIAKEEYDKVVNEKGVLKTNFDTLDKSIKELRTSIGAEKVEDIKMKFDTLEGDLEKSNKALKDQEYNFNLDKFIVAAKAKDSADIMPHIKKDSLVYKDGQFIGLDEQLTQLKESKPYLFAEDDNPGDMGGSGNHQRNNNETKPGTLSEAVAAHYNQTK